MKQQFMKRVLLSLAIACFGGGAFAADTPIYGSQLMTKQERIEYRSQLRAAKTTEEREQIRLQHHEKMQLRAKERGMTLPETPPDRSVGKGMQRGPGGGMGVGGPGGPGPNR